MRRVLITGAAGFIGSAAVREFVVQGWEVSAMVHKRTTGELESLVPQGKISIFRAELSDFPSLERIIKSFYKQNIMPDVVVHCAGRATDVGWNREFRKANCEATVNIVKITKRFHILRLVHVSTTDVYGLRDFHGEAEEELPMENNRRNPYARSKITSEQYVRRELEPSRYSIVRPAAVWGPQDRTLTPRIVAFLRRSPWIVHFGKWRGQNRWPLAHVRNVAMALYIAATLPDAAGQVFNVLDEEFTSIDRFYQDLINIYYPDRMYRTVVLPLCVGQMIGFVITGISNILNLKKPFADPSLYALYSISSNLDFSNQKMREFFIKAERQMISKKEGLEEFFVTIL